MSEWTAYCAPGRKAIAALALMLQGEAVAEVIESPRLDGSTDVWLVNNAAIEEALTLTEPVRILPPRQYRCPWCGSGVAHYSWCSMAHPPPRPLSECIILSGC